jgi:cysteine synthase A
MPGTIKPDYKQTIRKLWQQVGNTPMARIRYRYKDGPEQNLLVKCEYANITGSIKDRIVLFALEKAYEQGRLRSGDLIVDAVSGNTALALAAIGHTLGHRVRLLMPDTTDLEERDRLKIFRADVRLVSKADGGLEGCAQMAVAMSFHDGVFLPRLFEQQYQPEAYEKTTGREMGYYLLLEKTRPDALVAGWGSGATLTGIGKYLRILFPNMETHALERTAEVAPASNKALTIIEGDAILMAQRLAAQFHLPVGISSGANLLGAIQAQQRLDSRSIVVTVFPDDDKKYLGTGLFQKEPVQNGYLSPDIELTFCELTGRDSHVQY